MFHWKSTDSRGRIAACAAVTLGVVLPAGFDAPRAQVFSNIVTINASFSPNGDGAQDSTSIQYQLSDTANVDVIVLAGDSSTAIDTLRLAIRQKPDTAHVVSWRGRFADGRPAGEGDYVVFLRARNPATTDSLYRRVSIDLTRPQISIINMSPGVFAPGVATQPAKFRVDYTLFDAPASDSVGVAISIWNPANAKIATLINATLSVPGTYQALWAGTEAATDGVHKLSAVATDAAGNSAPVSSSVDVDLNPPAISIIGIASGDGVQTLPDSLRGRSSDRHGVKLVEVRYSQDPDSIFRPVPSRFTIADTVFFSVPLAAVLSEEKTHMLSFRGTDTVDRQRTISFDITLDATPPPPPVLDPAAGPSRSPSYLLTGQVDPDVSVMRIFRDGALIDTLFPNLPPPSRQFPRVITLVPGSNRISATGVDDVGNESVPSNVIDVIFDDTAGLYITQPFRPNDAFQINLSKPAQTVTLRIFDLGGSLVQALRHTGAAVNVAMPWSGRNGDGDGVKRGPLVAVADIRYEDGGKATIREIFLFDP